MSAFLSAPSKTESAVVFTKSAIRIGIFFRERVTSFLRDKATGRRDEGDDRGRDQPPGQLASSSARGSLRSEGLDEVVAMMVPDSESRLRRFKSERTSAAL